MKLKLPRNLQRFLCPNHGRAGDCIYKVSAAQLRGVHSGHTATHDLIQVFVFLRAIRRVPLSGFPCRSSFRPRPLSYSVVPFRIGEKVNPIYIALIASGSQHVKGLLLVVTASGIEPEYEV